MDGTPCRLVNKHLTHLNVKGIVAQLQGNVLPTTLAASATTPASSLAALPEEEAVHGNERHALSEEEEEIVMWHPLDVATGASEPRAARKKAPLGEKARKQPGGQAEGRQGADAWATQRDFRRLEAAIRESRAKFSREVAEARLRSEEVVAQVVQLVAERNARNGELGELRRWVVGMVTGSSSSPSPGSISRSMNGSPFVKSTLDNGLCAQHSVAPSQARVQEGTHTQSTVASSADASRRGGSDWVEHEFGKDLPAVKEKLHMVQAECREIALATNQLQMELRSLKDESWHRVWASTMVEATHNEAMSARMTAVEAQLRRLSGGATASSGLGSPTGSCLLRCPSEDSVKSNTPSAHAAQLGLVRAELAQIEGGSLVSTPRTERFQARLEPEVLVLARDAVSTGGSAQGRAPAQCGLVNPELRRLRQELQKATDQHGAKKEAAVLMATAMACSEDEQQPVAGGVRATQPLSVAGSGGLAVSQRDPAAPQPGGGLVALQSTAARPPHATTMPVALQPGGDVLQSLGCRQ